MYTDWEPATFRFTGQLDSLSHTSQGFLWSFDVFFHLGHISLSRHTYFVVRVGALAVGQGAATHFAVLWRCRWGRGPRGNNAAWLALSRLWRDWQFLLPPQPPQVFTASGSGFISLCWNPGLQSLSPSTVVPPSSSACKCGTALSASRPGPVSSPPWLPVSFYWSGWIFLNSLVVRLSYSLIFWQFRLFFVFKSVVSLFW